jgi:hypothetical protein
MKTNKRSRLLQTAAVLLLLLVALADTGCIGLGSGSLDGPQLRLRDRTSRMDNARRP